MKILVFHQPWPMGNYKYNTAIGNILGKTHEVYLLEQLNGREATDEYINQIIELDPDIAYFDMLDAETFKIIEKLKCKKILAYNTGGIVGYDEIFDYKDKWYTHVFTNSIEMKEKFLNNGTFADNYKWYLNCLPEEEMVYELQYEFPCVFLGMGFGRVTNDSYKLERDLFFTGFDDRISLQVFGNGWPQSNNYTYRGILPANDIGKLYSSSKSGFAIIAKGQRERGMINNRYSEMGSCGIPIISYNYEDIDWYGAEDYINFVTNKDEIVDIVRDINLGKDDKYKVKSENLQKFCKNQHKIFLEKLNNIMEI
tara:strand:+ start:362 stop:1294 length:933 start_codon:yes stop_codon:yes gene_type:complete